MKEYPTDILMNNVAEQLHKVLEKSQNIEYIKKKDLVIEVIPSKYTTPIVNLTDGKIIVSNTFIASVWCEIYSIFILFEEGYLKPAINKAFYGHLDTSIPIINIASIINSYATALICTPLPWPSYIPQPTQNLAMFKEYQPTKNNDLFIKAMVFILLHEVAHIILKHSPEIENKIEMENDADTFSIETILSTTNDKEAELYFLSLSVALAMQIKVKKKMSYSHNETHPELSTRIDRLVRISTSRLNSNPGYTTTLTCFLYTLYFSLLDIDKITTDFQDSNEWYNYIIAKIDTIIEN